jgi:hypothetical protein
MGPSRKEIEDMKKKLAFLLVALAAAVGAHLSTAPAEAAACSRICCPSDPSICVTCCPGKPCPRLACP